MEAALARKPVAEAALPERDDLPVPLLEGGVQEHHDGKGPDPEHEDEAGRERARRPRRRARRSRAQRGAEAMGCERAPAGVDDEESACARDAQHGKGEAGPHEQEPEPLAPDPPYHHRHSDEPEERHGRQAEAAGPCLPTEPGRRLPPGPLAQEVARERPRQLRGGRGCILADELGEAALALVAWVGGVGRPSDG